MKSNPSRLSGATSRIALLSCAAAVALWTAGAVVPARAAQAKPAAAQGHDDHATHDPADHAAQGHDAQHEAGAHVHDAAAKLVNPVKSTPDTLAAGKVIYDKQCASCHGATGLGDGKSGTLLNPKPSNLADASWKHGPSDGEIFTLVKDGAKNTPMKGYASKMTTQEMWSVVNYIRSLKK